MDALEIIAVLVALLITINIVLKRRKKYSSYSPQETHISKPEFSELKEQPPEIKLADKPVVNAEPTTVNSQIADTTVIIPEPKPTVVNIEPSAKPQVKETMEDDSSLPQDSILRRHYLANLCTMIETLVPLRPTESVLCRHYDTMIVAKIEQYLSDKKSMAQLIYDYEQIK